MFDLKNIKQKVNLLYRQTACLNLYLTAAPDHDPERIRAEIRSIHYVLGVIDEYLEQNERQLFGCRSGTECVGRDVLHRAAEYR